MVGKYVEPSATAYKSLSEALMHAWSASPTRASIFNLNWLESQKDSSKAKRLGVHLRSHATPCWCPAASASAASEGKIETRYASRARTADTVPGHLSSVCRSRWSSLRGPRRRSVRTAGQHRDGRRRRASIGHCPDYRVVAMTAARSSGAMPRSTTWAAPCALGGQTCRLDGRARSRGRDLRRGVSVVKERHRHRYEFNNTYLEVGCEEARPGVLRHVSGRTIWSEIIETAQTIRGSSACQFHPGIHVHAVRHGHPLFSGFVQGCGRRNSRLVYAQALAGLGRGELARGTRAGIEVGNDLRPLFLIAGPCVAIESRAACDGYEPGGSRRFHVGRRRAILSTRSSLRQSQPDRRHESFRAAVGIADGGTWRFCPTSNSREIRRAP